MTRRTFFAACASLAVLPHRQAGQAALLITKRTSTTLTVTGTIVPNTERAYLIGRYYSAFRYWGDCRREFKAIVAYSEP